MLRMMGWILTAGLVVGLSQGAFAAPKAPDKSGKATGLRAAAAALDDAHTALKRADEDARGRRNRAITLIEQAFTECEKGLEAAEGPHWKDKPISGGDQRDRQRDRKNYDEDNVGAWQEAHDALNDAMEIMTNESGTIFKGHKAEAMKLTKVAQDLVDSGLEAAVKSSERDKRTRQMRDRSDKFYSRLPGKVRDTAVSIAPHLLIVDLNVEEGDSEIGRLFHIEGISGKRDADLVISEDGQLWEAKFTPRRYDED
ncbi:MAG: hypothetical protein IT447_02750 [Phycisphaerales bacterium]|jgi:hypothetical protein|nr:hypothetical protein [Phycisphaerales bacterium]